MNDLINTINNINKINGTNSLTLLKLNNKLIFMFGDIHKNSRECNDADINLLELIEIFEKLSPKTDLLFEGYTFTQGYEDDIYLNRVSKYPIPKITIGDFTRQYWDCIGNDKNKCQSGNMRIHNINFRNHPSYFDLGNFDPIDKIDYMNLSIGLLYYNPKLIAESLSLKSIEDFVNNYYKVDKQYKDIPLADKVKQKLIIDYYDNVYQYDTLTVTKYSNIYMDAYAIGRILKTIFSYNDNKIIIVYAGSIHINNYISILTEINNAEILFNSKVDKTYEEYLKGLNMSDEDVYDPEFKNMLDDNAYSCFNLTRSDKQIIINALQSI